MAQTNAITATQQARAEQEQQRFKLRAEQIRRQQLVLQNELQSSGISAAQKAYLEQRVQTLSNEEDEISRALVRTEHELADMRSRTAAVRRSGRQQRPTIPRTERAPEEAWVQQQQLQHTTVRYKQRRRERFRTYERLSRQTKKAFILISASALFVALVADVLSIIDMGWWVSWLIPILTMLIVRRINAMNDSTRDIIAAQQAVLREFRITRQRLRPILAATGQARLFASAETLEIRHAASSYARTFIQNTILTQLLELIPIIDWLPMYLGGVVKILLDQHRTYRKVGEVLIPYRQTLELLDRLERLEIEYAALGPALQAA